MMDDATFIQALDLEKTDKLGGLVEAFNRLHDLPHSFLGLNWHSSHEYLYISQQVEALTGHPYESFDNHGIMFLFSVTPHDLIEQISSTLYEQLEILENDPRRITDPVTMGVQGGIIHKEGDLMPFYCMSTVLDFIPGQRKTYLVLSSYLSMNDWGSDLDSGIAQATTLQQDIHKLYMQHNPNRFRVFDSYKLLTPRELEIAELIRNGHNSKAIADKLSIALHTVTSHRKSLLKKMEAGNTTEMVHMLNQVS